MRTQMRRGAAVLVAAVLALSVGVAQAGAAGATIRPISDWLDAQAPTLDGSEDLFGGPMIFWMGRYPGAYSDDSEWAFVAGDYAGLMARWIEANGGPDDLAPTITGKILERPLADGRAMVELQLTSTNAIVYGFTADNYPQLGTILGASPQEIVEGAEPALGTVKITERFINTAPGAPMPDYVQLAFAPLPGQEYLGGVTWVSAFGPLGAESGYPVGTPGRIATIQVWHSWTPVVVPPGTTADNFPVELIHVSAIGK